MRVTCRPDKDIRLINNSKYPNLLASASITFDNEFVVRNLTVMNGSKGPFVKYPSEPYQSGGETKYADTAFPVTSELRAVINNTVMSAYEEAQRAQNKSAESSAANDAPPPEQDDEEEFENF